MISDAQRRASRALARGALVGALLLGLAACSQEAPDVSPDLRATLVNLAQVPPELNVAEAAAQAECLRALGWDVPLDLRIPPQSGLTNLAGITGIFTSADQAANEGYDSSLTSSDQPTPLDTYVATLSAGDAGRIDVDIFGDGSDTKSVTLPSGSTISMSTTGCLADARTEVYGSVTDFLQYASFRNEIAGQVRVDANTPGVDELMDEYASCMSNNGIDVANVYETQQLAAAEFGESRPPASTPSSEESALARADATCQGQAGILDALNEAFFNQAAQWISDNESWILGILEIKERSLQNAKTILEGAGGQG